MPCYIIGDIFWDSRSRKGQKLYPRTVHRAARISAQQSIDYHGACSSRWILRCVTAAKPPCTATTTTYIQPSPQHKNTTTGTTTTTQCKLQYSKCASAPKKNTTSANCTASRPSWAQIYRSGMQQPNAACTRGPPQCKYCPCATCIWLLHPALIDLCPRWPWHRATCAGGVFLPSTSTNTPLALMVVIACCNLCWWCFPRSTSAFTDAHIATCTVWWWWYSNIYKYIKGKAVWVNRFCLIELRVWQMIKKWCWSSTSPQSHSLHTLSQYGVPVYLPISTARGRHLARKPSAS